MLLMLDLFDMGVGMIVDVLFAVLHSLMGDLQWN